MENGELFTKIAYENPDSVHDGFIINPSEEHWDLMMKNPDFIYQLNRGLISNTMAHFVRFHRGYYDGKCAKMVTKTTGRIRKN